MDDGAESPPPVDASLSPGLPSPEPSVVGAGTVVDPSVTAQGWVPEPVTDDPELYARAALAAAGSVDTTRSERADWVAWLRSWFAPSPLYNNEQDALDQMGAYQAELDQAVLFDQEYWDELASEDGRVSATVPGELTYLESADTVEHNVYTASADVVMTYTRAAEDGEVSFDETVRISVQIVCGGESVPTAGTAQRPGDCKVIRFFPEPVG